MRGVALAGASLWRLCVAGTAWVGTVLAVGGEVDNLSYFTQQTNLLVAVYYTWALAVPVLYRGRAEPPSGGTRGAVVVYIVVTGVVFNTVMSGSLERTGDLLAHFVTPLLVCVDWLAVGRNQAALHWWHPLAWLAYPCAYLAFYLTRGAAVGGYDKYLYAFLDPRDGSFPTTVLGFLVGFVALGYLVLGVGRLRALEVTVPAEDDAGPAG